MATFQIKKKWFEFNSRTILFIYTSQDIATAGQSCINTKSYKYIIIFIVILNHKYIFDFFLHYNKNHQYWLIIFDDFISEEGMI